MIYFFLSLLVIIGDQWSKAFMTDLLPLCVAGNCQSIVLLPVFNFTLLHNEGAAFSFLSDAGGWQRWLLVVISALVSVVITVWLYRVRHTERLLATALALILGGAIGNLIDRVLMAMWWTLLWFTTSTIIFQLSILQILPLPSAPSC